MAQLRHDYERFTAAGSRVLVIVPNGRKMIEKHVQENRPPYPIVSDKGAAVAEQYGVGPKGLPFLAIFKPAVFLVGKLGKVLYTDYTTSYVAEPDNRKLLAVLTQAAT